MDVLQVGVIKNCDLSIYIYSISYLYVISFRMQKIPFRFKANTSETNLLFRCFAHFRFVSLRSEMRGHPAFEVSKNGRQFF